MLAAAQSSSKRSCFTTPYLFLATTASHAAHFAGGSHGRNEAAPNLDSSGDARSIKSHFFVWLSLENLSLQRRPFRSSFSAHPAGLQALHFRAASPLDTG